MVNGISGVINDSSAQIQPIKATNNVASTANAADGESLKSSSGFISVNESASEENDLNNSDEKKKKELSKEDVATMSDALNKLMQQANSDIEFKYCQKLDRLTMQIVDRKTQEIIKEFPPKQMLDLLIGIKEWVGILIDKKV